jgi:hypothetical protein
MVQGFMTLNKDQLIAMTEAQILGIIATYVTGGDAAGAIRQTLTLTDRVENMVTDTADFAQRRYDAGQRLLSLGKLGLQFLLGILAAGIVF